MALLRNRCKLFAMALTQIDDLLPVLIANPVLCCLPEKGSALCELSYWPLKTAAAGRARSR